MKKTKNILLSMICLATVCGAIWAAEHSQSPIWAQLEKTLFARFESAEDEAKEFALKLQPDEEFMQQRMFPSNDAESSLRGYQQFLAQVEQDVMSQQRGSTFAGEWTQEGPGNTGARYNTMAIHPTNPSIVYAGSCAGGLWKTTNAGTTWLPIFDSQAYLNIGTVILDRTNPNTVYVGTGDPNVGGYVRLGNGVWKSTNAGVSWVSMGLQNVSIVSKIVQHPTQTNTFWAACMGNPFLRDANRGVYKTTNGGTTWTKVLYADTQTGASDLIIDPNNPNTLYATTWTRIRTNSETTLKSAASKIYKSTDGGSTWQPLSNGLPTGDQGRIGLVATRTAPTKVYALYMDPVGFGFGGFYKTTDAGATWTDEGANIDPSFQGGQSWYFGKVRINPTNDNEIWLLGVWSLVSYDGGATWQEGAGAGQTDGETHADHHDLNWGSNGVAWLATDGGVYKGSTTNRTWTKFDFMPTNQIYRCTVNPFVNGEYVVGVQDNGTNKGGVTRLNTWQKYWYGDGFQALFDWADPNIWYASSQNGGLVFSTDGGSSFNDFTNGIDPNDIKPWDTPFRISPSDHTILYMGTNKVYRIDIDDTGQWEPISPVLTDPITDRWHLISSIEESTLDANKLWVGTSDGHVQLSSDAGTTWADKKAGLPLAFVTCVKPSLHNANTAFVSFSGYRDNDNTARIWKTTNNGTTWTNISGNLPQGAINDIELYQANPNVIFVATDGGVYATLNGGTTWTRIGNNMPILPVYDIETDRINNKLLAGTFARSLMSYRIADIVSTQNIAVTQNITLFPNPATDILQLSSLNTNANTPTQISIFTLDGRLIQALSYNGSPISIAHLPRGTYILRTQSGNAQGVAKFVKM